MCSKRVRNVCELNLPENPRTWLRRLSDAMLRVVSCLVWLRLSNQGPRPTSHGEPQNLHSNLRSGSPPATSVHPVSILLMLLLSSSARGFGVLGRTSCRAVNVKPSWNTTPRHYKDSGATVQYGRMIAKQDVKKHDNDIKEYSGRQK